MIYCSCFLIIIGLTKISLSVQWRFQECRYFLYALIIHITLYPLYPVQEYFCLGIGWLGDEKISLRCGGEKQFSRIFSEYIGIAPKDFLRIIRLQRTLSVLQHNPGISFAQLSYECGFTDQSHMIKEFKLFSGYTPKEYLNRYAPISDYFSSI